MVAKMEVGLERLFTLPKRSNHNYKRSIAVGLVVVLAVSFLFAGENVFDANPAVGDQDWAMFRHDVSHSGSSPSRGPNTNDK